MSIIFVPWGIYEQVMKEEEFLDEFCGNFDLLQF